MDGMGKSPWEERGSDDVLIDLREDLGINKILNHTPDKHHNKVGNDGYGDN